jgi:CubicO group peptidase (beta-lactamase class C family)
VALALWVCLAPSGCSSGPAVPPAPRGWAAVSALLDSAVAAGTTPGAVVGVSYRGRHFFHGSGRLGQDDATRPDSATLYDLASLTKVVGLTTLVMQAVSTRTLALDTPVVRYLPMFANGATPDSLAGEPPDRTAVTLRHLLTHSSGLPAWRPLYQEVTTRREAFALADTTPLTAAPGTRFVYSDLGAIVLTQIVEQVEGARIDSLFSERVARPLGLEDTRYLPAPAFRSRIAPTEADPWRGRVLRGEVHDENAARLDGVSGHAGLFSSARDLLRFADWILAGLDTGRQLPGSRFTIPRRVLAEFARRQDLPPGSSRALGWDTPSGESSGGRYLSSESIGHTGFTGTSIWIDPTRGLAIVLLSNRVHPSRSNTRFGPIRALVADRVVEALAPEALSR